MIGCSVAFHLALEGASVLLLERDDLASAASGAAAGMLTPLGEATGPGPSLRLRLAALRGFDPLCADLRERSGLDPQLVRSGALRVALSESEAEELHARVRAVEVDAAGELEWLAPDAARALESGLTVDLHGAVWSANESHVLAPVLTRAYATAAASLGARIETGTPVTGLLGAGDRIAGVRTSAGDRTAGAVVVCAGAWSPACLTGLGEVASGAAPVSALPVTPVRGQILALAPRDTALRTIVWGTGAYLVPKRDGTVVVGATEERVGFDCRTTVLGVRSLLDAAPRLVPSLASATFRGAWAGLRPGSPDHLPALGPWPGARGLFVAAGHHRSGVLLSGTTGQLVADLVRGKALTGDACALALARFAAPQPIG